MKIALYQMNSGDSWRKNLEDITKRTQEAARRNANILFLPENALFMGEHKQLHRIAAEMKRLVPSALQTIAKKHGVAIALGSYPEEKSRSKRIYNTSCWIDKNGKRIAKYRKVHLFDVKTPGHQTYRESDFVSPGTSSTVFTWRKVKIGLSVCFDVRFPEFYRSLSKRGAQWLTIPAAFTKETGEAHWHILLRARAIENLATVIAPAQTGTHSDGRKTFGHSLVIDPWGKVLLDAGKRPALHTLTLPNTNYKKLRQSFPVL